MDVDVKNLCDLVREVSFAIHEYHGHGYHEKIYENALRSRLRKLGLDVSQQQQFKILDEDGSELGQFITDLIIDDFLLVELKALRTLNNEHRSQVLHYLTGTGLEHALLMNFGSYKFQIEKLVKTRRKTSPN